MVVERVNAAFRNEDIAACFEELDKDGNGVLSPEEVISVISERLGFDDSMARYLVEMFDQNQDGSLDKTEFMQLWMSMFGHWTCTPVLPASSALKRMTHSSGICQTTAGTDFWRQFFVPIDILDLLSKMAAVT